MKGTIGREIRKVIAKYKQRLFYEDYINKLRRCQQPIIGSILDVGSGNAPFPCADVLCDLYLEDSSQRKGEPIRTYGKPFIVCDAQFLPFKDKAAGFIHCSHVLEHVDKPKLLLGELKRVGRHGYIETPSWFTEIVIHGVKYHKWVIKKRGNKLYYQRPRRLRLGSWQLIPFRLNERLFGCLIWGAFYYFLDRYSNIFTIRFYF